MPPTPAHRTVRVLAGAVCCGVLAGLVGMAMALFVDVVETLAFGHRISPTWHGVAGVAPWRVLAAPVVGGLVAGLTWWRIRAPSASLTSVERAINGATLNRHTLSDAVAQLVVVGSGASIGRETAPRQASAWAAQHVVRWLRLDADRRLLVAAAAGAGLAAVYNVPLAGAVMVVEMMLHPDLRTREGWRTVGVAALTSAVSTVTAWPVITWHPIYDTPHAAWSWPLLGWSATIALGAWALAALFGALASAARTHASPRHHLWWSVPLTSLGVGVIALRAPQVVGNGRPLVALALDHPVTATALAGLTVAKVVATPLSLRGGAAGGMLTPALAVGAGFGGAVSLALMPHADAGVRAVCALVGAAVVLALTQRAPCFAYAFVVELTHPGAPAAVCLALAVGVGFGVQALWRRAMRAARSRRPETR